MLQAQIHCGMIAFLDFAFNHFPASGIAMYLVGVYDCNTSQIFSKNLDTTILAMSIPIFDQLKSTRSPPSLINVRVQNQGGQPQPDTN